MPTTVRPTVPVDVPVIRDKHGHVRKSAGFLDDTAADRFAWRLFLVAGDPPTRPPTSRASRRTT
ncbi:hypothetical protein [Actinacidiphila sp. bgisy160]|uniref:hypothetical protein n=1 Tax=Actinacidiphila sp. bgisy160 TaxID=3413796 RepID=UPI003D73F2BC